MNNSTAVEGKVKTVSELKPRMQFNRLTLIALVKDIDRAGYQWLCRCTCGTLTLVFGHNLRKGTTKSCGCLNRESAPHSTHGKGHSNTYQIWLGMLSRCSNPNLKTWKDYGGRGITVCERWQVFENFLADMGEPLHGLTLDRIDNNGNYEPGNCRWATRQQQNGNRRNNVILTYQGETMIASDWSKRTGIPQPVLATRIRNGWDVERALTTPVMRRGRRPDQEVVALEPCTEVQSLLAS